jgi:O-antigen/teichoic acid export membrane protein
VPKDVSKQTGAVPSASQSEGRLVAKNMAYLAAAQVLTLPLSAVINALVARYLGPAEFGLFFLAGTMCGFGILIVEWGQQGVLPALIARDRSQAAGLLGAGFAWRAVAGCLVYLFIAGLSLALGQSGLFQWVLASLFLGAVLNSLGGGYKDAIRGFERTDIPAIAHVGQQVLSFFVVVPVMLLGGGLTALLFAGVLIPFVTVLCLSRASKPVGIGALHVRRENLKILLYMGTPFVFNDIAMSLQPLVDAMFLARLAPEEVVGWYAVSRRLIGLLILPASSLIGSLYPTLSRLWAESKEGYASTLVGALNGIALIAAPAALGCALYPEIGVAIFGGKEFGPAQDNLRVMALFLFLVYFSMPLQSALLAAGKQRAWGVIQLLCVIVSFALDPLLVPWFQERMGNGGMGLSVAAVISESFVVICGVAIMPRGVLNRSVLRTVTLTVLSGAAMAAVAFALKDSISPFVAAPVAVSTYIAAALMSGAITKSQRDAVYGVLKRRFGRFL